MRLRFDSKDAAIYTLEEPKPRKPNIRPRGYGGNFAHDRRTVWTH